MVGEPNALRGVTVLRICPENRQFRAFRRRIEISGQNDRGIREEWSGFKMMENLLKTEPACRFTLMVQMCVENANHLFSAIQMKQEFHSGSWAVTLHFVAAARSEGLRGEPERVHMDQAEQASSESDTDRFAAKSYFTPAANHSIVGQIFLSQVCTCGRTS